MQYRITRVESKIETVTKKKQVFNRETGLPEFTDDNHKFQIAYAVDGFTKHEGRLLEYPLVISPGYLKTGDVIEAFPDNNGWLVGITPLTGEHAIASPAPAAPASAPQPLPEVTTSQAEPWRFAVASGYAATPADIARFATAFFALEAHVAKITVALQKEGIAL